MQSTGHTSTHELSFVPMQGSAITYAMGSEFFLCEFGGRQLYEGVPAVRL
jgi:hypothetical protein